MESKPITEMNTIEKAELLKAISTVITVNNQLSDKGKPSIKLESQRVIMEILKSIK